MRRFFLVGAMLLLGAALTSAIGLSLTARGGYGAPLGGSAILDDSGYVSYVEIEGGNYTAAHNLYFSHGQGIKVIAGPELILLDNFSIELLGGYSKMPDYTIVTQENISTGQKRTTVATTSFFPVSLTVKGIVPLGRFKIYGGAGPSFAFMPKTVSVENLDDGAGTKSRWEYEMTYNPGWGFHGVVGINIALTKNLLLVVEGRAEQLSFSTRKKVLAKYTVNGTDELSAVYPDVNDRETDYVWDEYYDYLNNPVDPNKPNQELKYSVFGNSGGGFIGIVWRIF